MTQQQPREKKLGNTSGYDSVIIVNRLETMVAEYRPSLVRFKRPDTTSPLSLSLRQFENRLDPELFARTILPCLFFLSRGFIGQRNRRGLAAKLPAGSVYATVIDAATPNASHDASATCKNGHCRYKGKRDSFRRVEHIRGTFRITDDSMGGNVANGLSYEPTVDVSDRFLYPDLSYQPPAAAAMPLWYIVPRKLGSR